MKQYLGILIGIVVIAGVWWLLSSNQPKAGVPQPTVPANGQPGIVVYGNDGFTPATMEIAKGETVIFQNNSNHPMRVQAINSTDYPQFDQQQASAKNTTYELIFTQPGAWEYRNEQFPTHTGTITVK